MNVAKISIIIATYNRCESLKDVLDGLLLQEGIEDFNFEILAADNNSKDKTKDIIESYVPKFNGKLRYIFEARQGKSFALNSAIKEAKGEIIIFTDDDVIIDHKWLKSLYECFKEYKLEAAGGRVLPLYVDEVPKWVKENSDILDGPIAYHDFGTEIKPYETNAMNPLIGANMIIKKNCFDKYGLFRTDLGPGQGTMGDDTELFKRLVSKGVKIYYCGKALVWHKVPSKRINLRYIAKWFIAFGKYKALTETKNSKNAVYYFGIPMYLFKDISRHIFILIAKFFSRRNFLRTWIVIFIELGQILGYARRKCIQ